MFCCVEMARQKSPGENIFLFHCVDKVLEGSGSQPVHCDPFGDTILDHLYIRYYVVIHKITVMKVQ